MNSKIQLEMKNLMAMLKSGAPLLQKEYEDLLRYICPAPIFNVELKAQQGKVTLHFHDLNKDDKQLVDCASLSDARKWYADNFIHAVSMGVDFIQFHLAPIPSSTATGRLSSSDYRQLKIEIKQKIGCYLSEFEEGNSTESWSQFLNRRAYSDKLVSLTESLFGQGVWTDLVKKVMLDTGRYREDGDAILPL